MAMAGNGSATRFSRRRGVIAVRTGFGLLLILLAFSIFNAYKIQSGFSSQAAEIYHRHLVHDDLVYRLRRALWLGSIASRDYMIAPNPGSEGRFYKEIGELKGESFKLAGELRQAPESNPALPKLASAIQDYWRAVELLPSMARDLEAAARYALVQRIIVPRRDAVGDVVREFSDVAQSAFAESEAEFASSRRGHARSLLLVLGLTLLFGCGVAGAGLAHWESLEREAARQYKDLEHSRVELQQLSARLMEIQEQERASLSRELHDEIGQMVATFRMEVSRAESLTAQRPDQAREHLVRARQLADSTVQVVRHICLLLRPTILDDLGLGPALQWRTEDFSRRNGIPCSFQEENLTEDVPESVKTCVYRVLQEALHNCEKHSGATRVLVAVRRLPGELLMDVVDNGRGFDPEASGSDRESPRPSFGILGMKERAANVGGSLTITSAPGEGARVTLRIPMSKLAQQEPAPKHEEAVRP